MGRIEVLVCDDSALMRKSLSRMIESDPEMHVIGTARDGEDAVAKARDLHPDVITMDINMPKMDGITALQVIADEGIAPVLMVSSLTQEGAEITFEAMALGAFDYVGKPGGTVSANVASVASEIVAKLRAATRAGTLKKLARQRSSVQERVAGVQRKLAGRSGEKRVLLRGLGFKAVAIGISTGGPKTLFDVLPYISPELNAAVFVVQHMPAAFTNTFARRIDESCPMKCVEVDAGMVVEPGMIYLAKGGRHLNLYKKATGGVLIRTAQKPDHTFIPSVDVMMESVLSVFGADTVGVLMTGMGDDGADAMVKITESGGVTIAESDESAIVFGMPREAIERGGAKVVAPSWDIPSEIVKAVNR